MNAYTRTLMSMPQITLFKPTHANDAVANVAMVHNGNQKTLCSLFTVPHLHKAISCTYTDMTV